MDDDGCTDLYWPLNPFLVKTLPVLTMLLHELSGHQLYSEINTGGSKFMGGSGGVEFPWVYLGFRGVTRARAPAVNPTSISSWTSTRCRSDQ